MHSPAACHLDLLKCTVDRSPHWVPNLNRRSQIFESDYVCTERVQAFPPISIF